MEPIFSIGIQSLWDEVRQMPLGGVWWINADRYQDAVSLLNHTLSTQDKDAKLAAIVMEKKPTEVVKL